MKTITFAFLTILFAISLTSCEKEIEISTDLTGERFVIEGALSNQMGEAYVIISKAVGLTEGIKNPDISGALVTITDRNSGSIDTLKEATAGKYVNVNLMGVPSHSYTLDVYINDQGYSAMSTMPLSVSLEGINQVDDAFGGGSFGFGEDFINLEPIFIDPSEKNYYQFVLQRNDTLLSEIYILDDQEPIVALRTESSKGDSITVDLQCIDDLSYEYLFGVNENTQQSSAAPSNPNSNFSNGALGFFKAHTSSKKKIKIE